MDSLDYNNSDEMDNSTNALVIIKNQNEDALNDLGYAIELNNRLNILSNRERQIQAALNSKPPVAPIMPKMVQQKAEVTPYPFEIPDLKIRTWHYLLIIWGAIIFFPVFVMNPFPSLAAIIITTGMFFIGPAATVIHMIYWSNKKKKLKANHIEYIKQLPQNKDIADKIDQINNNRQAQLDEYNYKCYCERYELYCREYAQYQQDLLVYKSTTAKNTPKLQNELVDINNEKHEITGKLQQMVLENRIYRTHSYDIGALRTILGIMVSKPDISYHDATIRYNEIVRNKELKAKQNAQEEYSSSGGGILSTALKVGTAVAGVKIAGSIAGKSAAKAYKKEIDRK